MPNNVKNIVTFSSDVPEERIREVFKCILATDDSGNPFFDFNTLVPMPDSLNIESGTNTKASIHLYQAIHQPNRDKREWEEERAFYYLHDAFMREGITDKSKSALEKFIKTDVGRSLYELGKTAYLNQIRYGFSDWYDWCNHNWGTKWNSYSNEIDVENRIMSFETAWSFPSPIAAALADRFPDVGFVWEYADEDTGFNTGMFSYRDGETEYAQFENESDEAFNMYMSCWGEDSCLYKNDDGKWERYDCDSCPNQC